MKLDLNSIMIGTHQPKKLADFYEEVFEKQADMHDGTWYGWQVGSSFFSIGEHSEVKGKAKEPQRVILNLETDNVKKEFERIKEIVGVTVVKEPYTMGDMEDLWIATLADPDGNYFQLTTPWEEPDLSIN